ncbi:Mur ligase family protein, partial [Pelagibacteraceae bacterium]|nr:Mur ligase family protein [Pelagibacteraceae bacterium]
MLLSNLSKVISVNKTYNFNKNKFFNAITSNSKFTNNKTLFIYNKHTKVKRIYLDEALKNKTPAIISNKYINNLKIPQFVVSNINYETYSLLNKLHNNLPFKTLAVTGTNGKTSVVWYISKILNSLGYNNTTVGTLGHFINGKKINDINLTTPAYEELFKYGSSNKKEKNIYIFE